MRLKSATAQASDIGLGNLELSSSGLIFPLCNLKKGERAEVFQVNEKNLGSDNTLPEGELEKRLLEMGFVEGTEVTLQHEGMLGKDPIAVLIRVCSLVALRRKEAQAILVRKIL